MAESGAGETTEREVARIERDGQTGLAGLGLRLAEAKQLTAAIQAEIAALAPSSRHDLTVMINSTEQVTVYANGSGVRFHDIAPSP